MQFEQKFGKLLNPLDPNIIMHILDTVPYTFYGIDKENFV